MIVALRTPTPNPSPQGGGESCCKRAPGKLSGQMFAKTVAKFPSPLWGGVRGGGALPVRNPAGARAAP